MQRKRPHQVAVAACSDLVELRYVRSWLTSQPSGSGSFRGRGALGGDAAPLSASIFNFVAVSLASPCRKSCTDRKATILRFRGSTPQEGPMIGHSAQPRQMMPFQSSRPCPGIRGRQTTALKGAVVSVAASPWLAAATVAICRTLSRSVAPQNACPRAELGQAFFNHLAAGSAIAVRGAMNGLPFVAGLGRRRQPSVIRHGRVVGLFATTRADFLIDSPIPAGVVTGFLGHFLITSFPAQVRWKNRW